MLAVHADGMVQIREQKGLQGEGCDSMPMEFLSYLVPCFNIYTITKDTAQINKAYGLEGDKEFSPVGCIKTCCFANCVICMNLREMKGQGVQSSIPFFWWAHSTISLQVLTDTCFFTNRKLR